MNYLYSIKKGSETVNRFFSPSDFDTLEYLLSLFSLSDERLKSNHLFRDHQLYSLCREGFFTSSSDFVPCPSLLCEVSAVFDFCNQQNFDGRYNVYDVLSSWDCVNLWSDRWNAVVNLRADMERKCVPSPDSTPAIGSESSFEPDQPHCGDSEAEAINGASSDAGFAPACEEAQRPCEVNND